MICPNQPLDIHPPPTQLLTVDHFIAWLTHASLGRALGLSFGFTSNS
jgi:hypothetical protein